VAAAVKHNETNRNLADTLYHPLAGTIAVMFNHST
jgi:hypothetical protein